MNSISREHTSVQSVSYLDKWLAANKGRILTSHDISYTMENKTYHTSRMHVLFIYGVIPLFVTALIYGMQYADPMGWLYSLAVGMMLYVALVYTYPLSLESVYHEWTLSGDKLLFSNSQTPNMLVLPWYVWGKRLDSTLLIENIESVQLSTKTMGTRMENSFSFGAWSPKMNPFLQTEYILHIQVKDGSVMRWSSKNSELVFYTIMRFLNASVPVTVQ